MDLVTCNIRRHTFQRIPCVCAWIIKITIIYIGGVSLFLYLVGSSSRTYDFFHCNCTRRRRISRIRVFIRIIVKLVMVYVCIWVFDTYTYYVLRVFKWTKGEMTNVFQAYTQQLFWIMYLLIYCCTTFALSWRGKFISQNLTTRIWRWDNYVVNFVLLTG